jgi:hypothetical protein
VGWFVCMCVRVLWLLGEALEGGSSENGGSGDFLG